MLALDTIDKILKLMESHNVSAAQLTKEAGITNGLITQWKKHKQKPSMKSLMKIAKYFDVSIEYFMDGAEQTEKPTTPSNETPDLKHLLENAHGLMFNGEPLSDDDRKQILKVIQALQDK